MFSWPSQFRTKENKDLKMLNLPRSFDMDEQPMSYELSNEEYDDILWRGGHIILIKLYYYYLLKKYNKGCRILFTLDTVDKQIVSKKCYKLAFEIIDCLKDKTKNTDIIIIPFMLKYLGFYHINLLIYRKKISELEQFEPYGDIVFSNPNKDIQKLKNLIGYTLFQIKESLDSELRYNFPNQITPPVRVIRSSEVCSYKGFQTMEELNEENESCVIWSLIFMEFVLANPYMSSSSIESLLQKKIGIYPKYFTKLIKTYLNLLNKIFEEYFLKFYKMEMKFSLNDFFKLLQDARDGDDEAEIILNEIELKLDSNTNDFFSDIPQGKTSSKIFSPSPQRYYYKSKPMILSDTNVIYRFLFDPNDSFDDIIEKLKKFMERTNKTELDINTVFVSDDRFNVMSLKDYINSKLLKYQILINEGEDFEDSEQRIMTIEDISKNLQIKDVISDVTSPNETTALKSKKKRRRTKKNKRRKKKTLSNAKELRLPIETISAEGRLGGSRYSRAQKAKKEKKTLRRTKKYKTNNRNGVKKDFIRRKILD